MAHTIIFSHKSSTPCLHIAMATTVLPSKATRPPANSISKESLFSDFYRGKLKKFRMLQINKLAVRQFLSSQILSKERIITMGCNQSSENQWAYANENAPTINVSYVAQQTHGPPSKLWVVQNIDTLYVKLKLLVNLLRWLQLPRYLKQLTLQRQM